MYFATIKQNTGEDWKDAKLSLSTAMSSVGGSPPKLTVQNLYIDAPNARAPTTAKYDAILAKIIFFREVPVSDSQEILLSKSKCACKTKQIQLCPMSTVKNTA